MIFVKKKFALKSDKNIFTSYIFLRTLHIDKIFNKRIAFLETRFEKLAFDNSA